MQDEIELYKQILQAKKSHQNYISSIGPFGEQKISTRQVNEELSDESNSDIFDKF